MNKRLTTLLLFFILLTSNAFAYTYQHYSDGFFSSIHVLVVDPNEHVIRLVRAKGRETVQALTEQYGAKAAINGGFWKQNGDPAGILKIEGVWYGIPCKERGAIGWSKKSSKVYIDRVLTNEEESAIKVLSPFFSPEEWNEMDYILGGTPVLIQHGNVIDDFTPEQTLLSFLKRRHPRTAIGVKENGEWVFVVVDGRFYGFLGGMTIDELAIFMAGLGCVMALNLDGGGSSTMVKEGVVVNEPCGTLLQGVNCVEAVSDAILIF